MPVDTKICLLILAPAREMNLREFPGVDRLAVDHQPFIEYAKFFEPIRKLKRNYVFVDLARQFNLDLKTHWPIRASILKIHWRNHLGYPICTSGNLL